MTMRPTGVAMRRKICDCACREPLAEEGTELIVADDGDECTADPMPCSLNCNIGGGAATVHLEGRSVAERTAALGHEVNQGFTDDDDVEGGVHRPTIRVFDGGGHALCKWA